MLLLRKCRFANHLQVHIHKDKKTAHSFLLELKLFFFSVLMTICQRNGHFCGCKGTHIYCKTGIDVMFLFV